MKAATRQNTLDSVSQSVATSNSQAFQTNYPNFSFEDNRPIMRMQREQSSAMNSGDDPVQRATDITLERQNIGWPIPNYTYQVGHKVEARLDWNDPRKGTAPETPANDPVHKLNRIHGERNFVRGHLLNARLGGLGIWDNMFPITGEANKKHASGIEATAKEYLIAAKAIDDANNEGILTHRVHYNVQATAESPNNFMTNPNGKFVGTVGLRDWGGNEVEGYPDRSDVILSKHEHLDRGQELALDNMGWGYNQTPAGTARTGLSGPTNFNRVNDWMGERVEDESRDLGFPGFVFHPTHTRIGNVAGDIQTAENTASAAMTHITELLNTLQGEARADFLYSVEDQVGDLLLAEEV